jgi:hypothetical protein
MNLRRKLFAGGGGLVWLASLFILAAPEAGAETLSLDWTKTVNGAKYRHFDGRGVAIDSSGDVYVAGFTTTTTGLGAWVVMKMSADGTPLWSTVYHGYPDASGKGAEAYGIALDGSGNAWVVGTEMTAAAGSEDWLIRKYSPTGSLLASWTYNNSLSNWTDNAHAVAVNSSGQVAVVGSENRIDSAQGFNWRVIKYSSGGGILWSTDYNNPDDATANDEALAAAFDRNGNLFVAGYTDNTTARNTGNDVLVRKYTASGALAWSRTLGRESTDSEQANGVGLDASGNLFVVGQAENNNIVASSGTDWMVLKYSNDGELIWASYYSGPTPVAPLGSGGIDIARSVSVDSRGNAVVAGSEEFNDTTSPPSQKSNSRVLVFSPVAAIISGYSYNDPNNNDEVFMGVDCDQWGNVVAAGNMVWYYMDTDLRYRRNLYMAGFLRSGWPSRPPPAGPPEIEGEARLSRNAFSPARGQSLTVFVRPDAGEVVSVRVFTASGRRVLRLEGIRDGSDGWQELTWNGRDDEGRQVSRGVYLVNVVSGKLNQNLKVVVR